MEIGYKKKTSLKFEEAVEKTKQALAGEGFGVISEINVRETFLKKLEKDFGEYVILGACHPKSAWEVLSTDKEMGLLLPCNVVVYESENDVVVSTVLPTVALSVANHEELVGLAQEIEVKLKKVVDSM